MYVERPKLKLSNKKARFVIQDVDTVDRGGNGENLHIRFTMDDLK